MADTYFDNTVVNGIHRSRYIASWIKAKGLKQWEFEEWLKTLVINDRPLTDSEVCGISELFGCGKLELEINARSYLKNKES